MHALVHFVECANPFWRMRQSISSNAPVYFGECFGVFRYSGFNTTITTGLWWHWGVRKGRFQQSDTEHSGTKEKETPNVNAVGKKLPVGKL